jgi:hypothetical protein
MDILIWKSHGDICVYDVSTPEKLKAHLDTAIYCVQGWGLDEKIAAVQKHINMYPDDLNKLRQAFNTLRAAVWNDDPSEMFEEFYLDVLQ